MIKLLLIYVGIVGLVIAGISLVANNVYEVRELKKQKMHKRTPHARRYRKRPLITVIVVAQNSEQTIGACLDSLCRSNYRKLEILVVDNDSNDTSKRLVRDWAAANKQRPLRLIARRNATNQLQAVAEAYRKYGNGQLLLVLHASQQLATESLENAVLQFNADSTIRLLQPNIQLTTLTVTGLFQKYIGFLSARWKKVVSLTGLVTTLELYGTMGKVEALLPLFRGAQTQPKGYQISLLLPGGQRSHQIHYASSVRIESQSAQSMYRLLCSHYTRQVLGLWLSIRLGRQPAQQPSSYRTVAYWLVAVLTLGGCLAAVALPVCVSYCLYLAFRLHEPELLMVVVLMLSTFLVAAIWSDDGLKLRAKLLYVLGVPVTYVLFGVLSLVQAIAVFRLMTPRRLRLLSVHAATLKR